MATDPTPVPAPPWYTDPDKIIKFLTALLALVAAGFGIWNNRKAADVQDVQALHGKVQQENKAEITEIKTKQEINSAKVDSKLETTAAKVDDMKRATDTIKAAIPPK